MQAVGSGCHIALGQQVTLQPKKQEKGAKKWGGGRGVPRGLVARILQLRRGSIQREGRNPCVPPMPTYADTQRLIYMHNQGPTLNQNKSLPYTISLNPHSALWIVPRRSHFTGEETEPKGAKWLYYGRAGSTDAHKNINHQPLRSSCTC